MPFFISGAQMVALNFQTKDKELQINQGWFLQNGGCGYVLKPNILLQESKFKNKISTYCRRNLDMHFKSFFVKKLN